MNKHVKNLTTDRRAYPAGLIVERAPLSVYEYHDSGAFLALFSFLETGSSLLFIYLSMLRLTLPRPYPPPSVFPFPMDTLDQRTQRRMQPRLALVLAAVARYRY